MRENTSAFQCPLYCFSKSLPPPPHCEPSSTLESEDSEQKSSRPSPVSLVVEDKKCDVEVENDENGDGKRKDFLLKSSLKKTTGTDAKEIGKECVRWMDDLGKELAEIREFEPVEHGELDDEMDGYPACACVIV